MALRRTMTNIQGYITHLIIKWIAQIKLIRDMWYVNIVMPNLFIKKKIFMTKRKKKRSYLICQ